MYISELAQEDLIAKAKALLPSGAAPLVEKAVETYQKYKSEKKPKTAPPAALTTSFEPPPSGPKWVVPVVIGTVVVGGLGLTAWFLLRKKAS